MAKRSSASTLPQKGSPSAAWKRETLKHRTREADSSGRPRCGTPEFSGHYSIAGADSSVRRPGSARSLASHPNASILRVSEHRSPWRWPTMMRRPSCKTPTSRGEIQTKAPARASYRRPGKLRFGGATVTGGTNRMVSRSRGEIRSPGIRIAYPNCPSGAAPIYAGLMTVRQRLVYTARLSAMHFFATFAVCFISYPTRMGTAPTDWRLANR